MAGDAAPSPLGGRLAIGELAARGGAAASALRYYETAGLITTNRSAASQRRYRRAPHRWHPRASAITRDVGR